jgi:hypothetical protein
VGAVPGADVAVDPGLDVADGRVGAAVWTHDLVGGRVAVTVGAADGLVEGPLLDPGAWDGAATCPGSPVTQAGSHWAWVGAVGAAGGVAGAEVTAAAGATSAGSSGPSAT